MSRTHAANASLVLNGDNLTFADAARTLRGQIAELQVVSPACLAVE